MARQALHYGAEVSDEDDDGYCYCRSEMIEQLFCNRNVWIFFVCVDAALNREDDVDGFAMRGQTIIPLQTRRQNLPSVVSS